MGLKKIVHFANKAYLILSQILPHQEKILQIKDLEKLLIEQLSRDL